MLRTLASGYPWAEPRQPESGRDRDQRCDLSVLAAGFDANLARPAEILVYAGEVIE
jgi:hypothetical protein